MRIYLLYFLCLVISFCMISCSQSPGDVLEELRDQQVKGNSENVRKYYTSGTAEALDELAKITPKGKDEKLYSDKKFIKGTKWEVINENINGDEAEVVIKYIDHPIENMKGLELTFRLKKEEGEWKIDMEKELRTSLEMLKISQEATGGKQDFLDKMKKYMNSE